MTKSKIPDSDSEVRPLTFRAILEALTSLPSLSERSASSFWNQRFPALYRDRSFRCIDPSDVQSLRLISAVPGVRWRRYCSEPGCLFSQITAPRGSPLLSHTPKKKACLPLPKSAVSLKRSVPNGHMRTHSHTHTHHFTDRFTQRRESVARPCWGWSKSESERERREGSVRGSWAESNRGKFEKEKAVKREREREKKEVENLQIEFCLLLFSSSWESPELEWFVYEWSGEQLEVNWDSLYWQQQSGPHLTPP